MLRHFKLRHYFMYLKKCPKTFEIQMRQFYVFPSAIIGNCLTFQDDTSVIAQDMPLVSIVKYLILMLNLAPERPLSVHQLLTHVKYIVQKKGVLVSLGTENVM